MGELEGVVRALEHVVLLAPHVLPVKSYMLMLREYVPELVCVIPDDKVQTIVVVPVRDALTNASNDIGQSIPGALIERISVTGPAYKKLQSRLWLCTSSTKELRRDHHWLRRVRESPRPR